VGRCNHTCPLLLGERMYKGDVGHLVLTPGMLCMKIILSHHPNVGGKMNHLIVYHIGKAQNEIGVGGLPTPSAYFLGSILQLS